MNTSAMDLVRVCVCMCFIFFTPNTCTCTHTSIQKTLGRRYCYTKEWVLIFAFIYISFLIELVIFHIFNILNIACKPKKNCHIYELKWFGRNIWQILGYRHSKFVNKLVFASWFHEEHIFYCCIGISFTDVGIIFLFFC